MEQICDLEAVKPQEIPIKVCDVLHQKFVIEAVERKQVFLRSFNIPRCIVVGLLMVEGLLSLLFNCESGIN